MHENKHLKKEKVKMDGHAYTIYVNAPKKFLFPSVNGLEKRPQTKLTNFVGVEN